jgi:hypothetical protein
LVVVPSEALKPVFAQIGTLFDDQLRSGAWDMTKHKTAWLILESIASNWPPDDANVLSQLQWLAMDLDPVAATILRSGLESLRIWLDDRSIGR